MEVFEDVGTFAILFFYDLAWDFFGSGGSVEILYFSHAGTCG